MSVQVHNFELSQLTDGRWLLTWANAEVPDAPAGPSQWALDGQRLTLASPSADVLPWHFEPIPPEVCSLLQQTPHQGLVYATLDDGGRPVAGGAAEAAVAQSSTRRFGR